MLFQEVLVDALQTIQENEELQEVAREDKTFAERVTGSLKVAKTLRQALEAYLYLQESLDVSQLSSDLMNDVYVAITEVSSNVDSGYLHQETLSRLRKTEIELSSTLERMWSSVAVRDVQSIKSALLVLSPFAENREQVKSLIEKLRVHKNGVPKTLDSAKQLYKALLGSQQLIEEFGLDAGVQEFVQKAIRNKATLLDLTPEIEDWIMKHELEDKFRIGIHS